jgi:transposase
MKLSLDSLLDLPGITVEGLTQVEDNLCLQVKILAAGINCPYCQKHTQELHQTRFLLIRDLPSFGRFVYLRIPR